MWKTNLIEISQIKCILLIKVYDSHMFCAKCYLVQNSSEYLNYCKKPIKSDFEAECVVICIITQFVHKQNYTHIFSVQMQIQSLTNRVLKMILN